MREDVLEKIILRAFDGGQNTEEIAKRFGYKEHEVTFNLHQALAKRRASAKT